jgi:hypothetical protein
MSHLEKRKEIKRRTRLGLQENKQSSRREKVLSKRDLWAEAGSPQAVNLCLHSCLTSSPGGVYRCRGHGVGREDTVFPIWLHSHEGGLPGHLLNKIMLYQ